MYGALMLTGAIGFASGILCRSLFIFPVPLTAFAALLSVAIFCAHLLRPRIAYLCCAAFLACAAFGAWRTAIMPSALPDPFAELVGAEVALEGVVAREPDIRETTQRIAVKVERQGERTIVLAVAPLFPEVRYGERIRVSGELGLPEPFETDTGREFRYDRFLAKDGVFAMVSPASLETVSPAVGVRSAVMGGLLAAKRGFGGGLAEALPEPHASLASGMLTGGKQGLGPNLLDAFVAAGLVHIVVLSGYNVMIVAEAVLRVLSRLPRACGAAIAAGVIGLFVLAAGAGSASMRAGLMAGIALLARGTGRTYAVLGALAAACVLMLLLNPLLLAYDPGFQLSFIATLGLVLLSPMIEARFAWIPSAFWRGLVASTLAAQLAVLPLLLYSTGVLSLASLPANLLVLPAVPLAMALSFLAGLIGMVAPPVAAYVGLPAYAVLAYAIGLAQVSAGSPFAIVTIPEFPPVLVVVAYAGLGWLVAKSGRAQGPPAPANEA